MGQTRIPTTDPKAVKKVKGEKKAPKGKKKGKR